MGGQTFEIDHAAGIVRIVGNGMWTPRDARQHFSDIEAALRPLRETRRTLVFLLDMRDAVVQSRETAEAMKRGAMRMHRATDIVAVVTTSALHAMQIKSDSSLSRLATFRDMDDARLWAEQQRIPA